MIEGIGRGIEGAVLVLMVIAAVVGWATIEGVIWLFSHITIGWAS